MKDETARAAKPPKHSSVDFANYSLQRFEQDAASLTRPGSTLLPAKGAGKEQACAMESGLRHCFGALGVEGQLRNSVYGAFKLAIQNIALKRDRIVGMGCESFGNEVP